MRIKMAVSAATLILTQNLILANETTKLDDVQVVTSASGYEQNVADAPARPARGFCDCHGGAVFGKGFCERRRERAGHGASLGGCGGE